MAKKSIIFSNGDGRVYLSNTDLLSVDDVTYNISASAISASGLSISSLNAPSPRLLNSSNGAFSTFNTASANGALVFNGTTYVTSTLTVSDYSGSPSQGDISGSYLDDTRVVNISNVSSGSLPVNYGGTGLQLATNTNYLLKAVKSAGNTTVTALSLNSGSVVASFDGKWTVIPPGYPDVRFYTSGSTGNTFTWTKPAGARFARVILQGAGGGGGGVNTTTNGGGGGSGGFTDITIDISALSTLYVTGGLGGIGSNNNTNTAGAAGGATYVGPPNTPTVYYALGGAGGGVNNASPSAGGVGLTRNGAAGAGANGTAAAIAYSMPSGGGRGGGAPGTIIPMLLNKNFGYNITSDGIDLTTQLIDASGSYGSTAAISLPPRPGYGAGGGGGAFGPATKAGDGGHGYALIISW